MFGNIILRNYRLFLSPTIFFQTYDIYYILFLTFLVRVANVIGNNILNDTNVKQTTKIPEVLIMLDKLVNVWYNLKTTT